LSGCLLPVPGRPPNPGDPGHIGRHRDAQAPEQLDTLDDVVDELHLLSVVLVEAQMKLVEGLARDLPVVLRVEVVEVIVSAMIWFRSLTLSARTVSQVAGMTAGSVDVAPATTCLSRWPFLPFLPSRTRSDYR
jgi:hypothetical protein